MIKRLYAFSAPKNLVPAVSSLIILFLLFSFQYTTAQTGYPNAKEKIKKIDDLIYKQPDSAKVIIRQIISYHGKNHDTINAIANTYYGYYHLLKNDLDSSIYYYNKAISYSHSWPVHKARALRNMAAPYRKKGDHQKSLKILAEAESKYLSIGDKKGLATVYGEIAANYNLMLRSHDAIPYLLKALPLLEDEDKIKITIKQSLANTYMNTGNYKFAVDLYKEVIPAYKARGQMKNYYLTLVNYSECLVSLERISEAKIALKEAIAGIENYKDFDVISRAYASMGRLEATAYNLEQANLYYGRAYEIAAANNSPTLLSIASFYTLNLRALRRNTEALSIIERTDRHPAKAKANLEESMQWEKAKAEIYNSGDKNDKALAAMENTVKLMDTLEKTQNNEVALKLQGEYQHDYQLKKNTELKGINGTLKETAAENNRLKMVQIVLPLFILIMLLGYFLYSNRKHKDKIAAAKASAEEIANEREAAKKVNQELMYDIEEKSKKLSMNESTMVGVHDNINKLIGWCNNGQLQSGIHSIGNLKEELEEIINDDNYWKLFRKAFSESHAEFEKKLSVKYPALSKKDLFFCTVLNLHLPYKDIAVILQVVPETVRKRKYRLKKKMGMSEEDDLETMLAQI